MSESKEIQVGSENGKQMARTLEQAPEFQPIDAADTVRIPRLVLIQEKRQEIKDGLAQAGDLLNSLSKENYGGQIEVVPLIQRRSTRIRWAERDSGGGLLCVSRDGITGQGKHGVPGVTANVAPCADCMFYRNYSSREGCTMNYEIIAMIRETMEPILLTAEYTRSSDAGIRDMLGVARNAFNAKGTRLFGKSYILKSAFTKNKKGEFFKLVCAPGNNNAPLPEADVELYQAQMSFFKQAKLEVDQENQSSGQDDTPRDW